MEPRTPALGIWSLSCWAPRGLSSPFALALFFCLSSWADFLESLYTSCLPYLSFPLQPTPTCRVSPPPLHGSGFCQVTSSLSAAKSAAHVSVFTSLNLLETFNPVGCDPLLGRLYLLSLHDSSPMLFFLPL